MSRNVLSSVKFLITTSFILSITTGCSWVSSTRRSLFGHEEPKNVQKKSEEAKNSGALVAKEEYDSLLKKYEELNQLYLKEKERSKVLESGVSHSLPASAGSSDLVETVDVFGNKDVLGSAEGIKIQTAANKAAETPLVGEVTGEQQGKLEAEIVQLRKVQTYLKEKNYDKAMEHLQTLERSNFGQVRARAKYYIGCIFFDQKEYDLALQVYEEVVQKYAFSGVVLQALGGLVESAQALKLTKKRDQYQSLLSYIKDSK